MKRNIEMLAEIGEEELNRDIGQRVQSYIEGLSYIKELYDGSKMNLAQCTYQCAYSINLSTYLESRKRFVSVGLDPTEYDNQIRNALKKLNIETEPFEEIMQREKIKWRKEKF